RKLTVSAPAPLAPVLTNPPAAAFTNDTTPLLDWNSTTTTAGGPFTYEVQVCANAACTTTIYDSATTTDPDTDHVVVPTLNPGLYYWRVRTVNAVERPSAYSAARTFTVRTNIMSAPADNTSTLDTTPLFSWLAINYPAATPPPVKYRLEVDSATTFDTGTTPGEPDYAVEGLTVLTHAIPAPSALTAGTWYWRVLISIDGGTNYDPVSPANDYRTLHVSTVIPLAPVLQFPTNNGTTGDTTPTLQWKGSTSPTGGPFSYQVQVSTVNNFATTVYVNNNVPANGCTPTTPLCSDTVGGALGNGTYYWRVRTVTTLGAPGAYSAVFKFIVNAPNPAIPTQKLPADNAVTNLVRPTLSWLATPNANRYHLVVNPTNTCTVSGATIVNFTTATPVLAQALSAAVMPAPLPQGEYFWCVEALDAALFGSGFQASPRRFVVNLSNVPADNANIIALAAGARPVFSWLSSGLPAGTTYQLKISTNPDMTGQVYLGPVLTTLSHVIPLASPLLYDQYYWQVAVNGTFPDPAIVKRTFIVTPALPLAPMLTGPVTGSSFSAVLPLLQWNDLIPPPTATWTVDHYEVQIAKNATFTLNLQSFNPVPSEYQVVGPLGEGTYYWRVRAYNNYLAPGAFSAARTFIIDGTGTLVPSLTLPADNSSSGVKTPTFTWTKPVGAVRFEIRYSSNYPASYAPGDELNTTGTVAITSLTPTTLLIATSYKPPSPLIPGTYYWQVRAFDAAGNPSPWTNLRTFKIFSLTTDTPQPNRFGPADDIILTWGPLSWVTNAAPPDGGYYEIQIDNNLCAANALCPSPEYELRGSGDTVGNGITFAVYTTNFGVEIPSGMLPAGLPNGTWYWHVRGYNPDTNAYGAWSSTGTFVVDK
ncbi:MAG: hypothetical protein K8I30_21700, partial [Anaerolineae bacterium]|nr:hypothetical protein [Anaerolineae bacterium]